ncbi:MAG TPA: hypothetical protein VG188_03000 [Solirubrobacteraceae bacterium]|nr:hypothetical protein [Solirubrobacteraceae bacterium]
MAHSRNKSVMRINPDQDRDREASTAAAGAHLLFGADGRLRAEDRVLAFVVADRRAGALGRLVAEDLEVAIVTAAGAPGWRFDLLDESGRRAGEFRPFRLRRGGRLRAGELTLALQGNSWSHDRWSFATREGDRVEATVKCRGERPVAGSTDLEIALESSPRAAARAQSAHPLALAFGCWLIARWHALAPGDHMLTSEGPAEELASALRPSAGRGIAALGSN